jgi:hypothetical protein
MDPQETRWELMKAMLDSFPYLKERMVDYLKVQ